MTPPLLPLLGLLLPLLLEPAPEQPAGPPLPGADTVGPAPPPTDLGQLPDEPPFPVESLGLSDVLKSAIGENIDLRMLSTDVKISEARILAAVGAYDVFLTAGLNASLTEQPQRGSAFAFSRGSRALGGNVGFRRNLETGGTIDLNIDISRSIVLQPLNFTNPASGQVELATYSIVPRLTLTHPLLKNAGLRVNRVDINKAKIAKSQAEATVMMTAQNSIRDIISGYWDVLFAQRDLQNKRRSVRLAQQQLDRTRIQVQAGRLAPIEMKAVEQAQATREIEVLIAETALLDRSLNLRQLMGQNLVGRSALGVTPSTDPVIGEARLVNVNAEIERALGSNAQVRQLELALASRRLDELKAANQRLPQLDFQGTFRPQGRSVDTLPNQQSGAPGRQGNWGEAFKNFFNTDPGADGLLADWFVEGRLNLTWDVQNRTPKGNHQVMQLEVQKARYNLQKTQQTISASIVRAGNSLRTASKRMDVARISIELAEENLRAEQARFEVGRATNFEVMQRLDQLDTAQKDALNAQIEYLKALVQLQALNGEILPAYGLELG